MKFNLIGTSYSTRELHESFDNIDFEGGSATTDNTDKDNLNGPADVADINKQTTVDTTTTTVNDDKSKASDTTSSSDNKDKSDDTSSTGELSAGDKIEFDGATYTVDDNGNIVDDKGNIFKNANEVSDWLKSVDTDTTNTDSDNTSISIEELQDKFNISITDEQGKPVQFTNDADGVVAFVNSVMDIKTKDIQEATINKFLSDNPYVEQFVNYCQVTGSPQGFGDIPDRSGITLDKDNEQQLEYVIRLAAKEFGNKTINENYIKYLKSSGGLYDEANAQLQALVEKDKQYKAELARQAEINRQEEQRALTNYWKNVNSVIDSRTIAGYKIPESFIRDVDGKKITLTPNDFYNYISRSIDFEDGTHLTGYQRDLNQLTEAELLDRELLDAWLMFTGGSYKDLVNMAVKEEQVKTLRLKSKEQRTNKTVKIIKNNEGKVDFDDIIL